MTAIVDDFEDIRSRLVLLEDGQPPAPIQEAANYVCEVHNPEEAVSANEERFERWTRSRVVSRFNNSLNFNEDPVFSLKRAEDTTPISLGSITISSCISADQVREAAHQAFLRSSQRLQAEMRQWRK